MIVVCPTKIYTQACPIFLYIRPPARGTEEGMESDDLLCSRNARLEKALVGRAQWKINQPPSPERRRASLEGTYVNSLDRRRGGIGISFKGKSSGPCGKKTPGTFSLFLGCRKTE
jgi:hypothetical protein